MHKLSEKVAELLNSAQEDGKEGEKRNVTLRNVSLNSKSKYTSVSSVMKFPPAQIPAAFSLCMS